MLVDTELSREAARELARRELQDPKYDEAQPSLVVRLLGKAIDAIRDLFDRASGNVPGGRGGLVVVLLVVVALVVLVLLKVRPAASGGRGGAVFTSGRALSAEEHRALAHDFAARGELAEAVRERLRAIVRELESRGVLDPRPGRTADEVAREAGQLVPSLAEALRRGATTFDEVWYGGRDADRASYDVLVEVDRLVTSTRMVLA